MKSKYRKPTANEQQVLDGVKVRLVRRSEEKRFEGLIRRKHYLKNMDLVGRRLLYVAEYKGKWLALLTWSTPALHIKARDTWIGWSEEQRRRRLKFLINNSRYVILTKVQYPNLATRVMGLCLQRVSADWEKKFGYRLLAAESFVDGQLFRGTCYQAANWTRLGETQGWGRAANDFYVAHNRPKQLWVRELVSDGRQLLRSEVLPADLAPMERKLPQRCSIRVPQMRSLWSFFHIYVQDWRKPHGLRYPLPTILAIIACAAFCRVPRGQRDLAEFADRLSQKQRRVLRCPYDKRRKEYLAPKETTFFRVLTQVAPLELERALQAWQTQMLGPLSKEEAVVFDGKEPDHAGGAQIISAVAIPSLRWLGSEQVSDKSNEIPAGQRLVERVDVEGRLVLADALHTQQETARKIVFEKGGEYVFMVKRNQPGILGTITDLLSKEVISPWGQNVQRTSVDPHQGNQSQS
jgi:predicted transposase YbfD/YdcC